MPTTLDPEPSGDGRRIAIVATRFTRDISDLLLERTLATLIELGVADSDITVAWVPGSLELPLVCDTFARASKHDGIIALGCVIRGETTHYDYVCEGATRGILDTGLRHGIPVIFGVLTTENRPQAQVRADGTRGDKGADCARAVLSMIDVIAAIRNT